MFSQDQPPCNPSPRAAVLVGLTYSGEPDGFWEYLDQVWLFHWEEICALAATNIRFPSEAFDLEWLMRNRKEVVSLEDLTKDSILYNIPGSYEGQSWRGFAYRSHPFRCWHFVTHEEPQNNPDPDDMKLCGLIWYKVVESFGQKIHWHGLAYFVFPRPAEFVRSLFGLDHKSEITPTWGSWESALKYLNDQASSEFEVGERPRGIIWVDGNNLKPASKWAAAREGESPIYTGLFNNQYQTYLSKNSSKFSNEIVLCETNNEAVERCKEESIKYTRRWFVIDCKQLIYLFDKDPPRNYKGQEALAIINVPVDSTGPVTNPPEGSWLKGVPFIAYSLARNS